MNSLVIVDYGVGNLFGLKQACLTAGLNPVVTNDKKKISEAKGLILPGVGSFSPAIEMLKTLEIIENIRNFASSGKTLLGLCLGMQLLLDKSVEFGEHKGLGLISGNVEYLGDSLKNRNNVKIPHMGWNTVKIKGEHTSERIFESLPKEFDVYFAHSFWIKSLIKDYVFAETEYADVKFCSAIKKNNIIGFQFHPENSGLVGIQLLKNIFGN
jgi:glutamine amidotransferase|tara:strand:+ start:275 stop:910 length:636 start_codon:yes stop_codon:yes gene_type:complete